MYNMDGYYYYNPSYGRVTYFLPAATIQDQITKFGRQGHCFSSTWGGREHTFILVGFDATTGMVSINENGVPSSVHHTDMVGLTYQGAQCPSSGSGTGGGPGSGPQCRWVWIPGQGWRWICH